MFSSIEEASMSDELTEQRDQYLELNRNESRLIAERLKGLLTFHGFLFAAVGLASTDKSKAILLSIIGAVICISWYRSVRLSYAGLEKLSEQWKTNDKEGRLPGLDSVSIEPREIWLLPEVFLPVAIGITWLLILLTALFRATP
jgi:hypothetical protein